MCLIRRSFLPSRIRLRSAGINSFCLSSSDCKVFASLTHSPSLLHLLFTMSTLDRDATSEQAALTSVGRPEKLEKGCPIYTACFRNCSGVHLTPKPSRRTLPLSPSFPKPKQSLCKLGPPCGIPKTNYHPTSGPKTSARLQDVSKRVYVPL